jgi:hypothetical protein
MIELFTEEYFWTYAMYVMYMNKKCRYVGKW